MVRVLGALALALGLLGCHQTVVLEPPPTPGAASLILLIEEQGELQAAYAYDLSQPVDLAQLRLDAKKETVLHAAIWQTTLEDLLVAPGPIELSSPEGQPLSQAPERAYVLEVGISGWTPQNEVPDLWAQLRTPRASRVCETWGEPRSSERSVPNSVGKGGFLVARFSSGLIGNSAGLWSLRDGAPHVILDSTSTAADGLTWTSTGTFLGGYPAPVGFNEVLYLYANGGALYEEQLDGRYKRLLDAPGATASAEYVWTSGPEDDNTPFEFALLDSNGGLWTYDDLGWTKLMDPDPAHPLGPTGGVTWTGLHSWVVVGPNDGQVLRVREGVITVDMPPGLTRATAAAQIYGLGLFVGDAEGGLWRNESNHWNKVDTPLAPEVVYIHYLRMGVVYGGSDGNMIYQSDADPRCHESLSADARVIGMTGGTGRFNRMRSFSILSSPGYAGDPAPLTLTRVEY